MIESFRVQLAALLEADPRLRTVEILHRMRQAGYAGGKSALYEMVRLLRPHGLPSLSAFEDLPGVLSQHDFGAVVVTSPTGRRERLRFFASRLKYSRYLDVRLMPNDGIESLVRSLLAGFEAFGGVPLVAMFHNPRTVTLGRDGQRIEWDPTFGQAAVDYRFAPELCARGGGEEKRRGDDLAGFVRGSFFKVRRFRDYDDILPQLADWQHEINTARPRRATGVTPHSRLEAERERLRALAIPPAEYALRFPVAIGRTGLVEFQGSRYTLPREACGIPGLLWLYPECVRIVAGRYRCEQARVSEHGADGVLSGQHATPRLAHIRRQEPLDAIPEALRAHRSQFPEGRRLFPGN